MYFYPLVSRPTSVTFSPSREGVYYRGTSLNFTCRVTLDKSVVDTNVAIDLSILSMRIITSDVVQLNDSTYLGTASVIVLLPEGNGASYSCSAFFRPLTSTPFVVDGVSETENYTLVVAGKVNFIAIYSYYAILYNY